MSGHQTALRRPLSEGPIMACSFVGPEIFTYFIANDAAGAVKIGSAADPVKRLSQLQVGNATELRLVGYLPLAIRDESFEEFEEGRVQDYFAAHRVRGEWFSVDAPGLAAYLEVAAEFADWHGSRR